MTQGKEVVATGRDSAAAVQDRAGVRHGVERFGAGGADADGRNAFASKRHDSRRRPDLTPHTGEFGRLLTRSDRGKPARERGNGWERKQRGAVLKGHRTNR